MCLIYTVAMTRDGTFCVPFSNGGSCVGTDANGVDSGVDDAETETCVARACVINEVYQKSDTVRK